MEFEKHKVKIYPKLRMAAKCNSYFACKTQWFQDSALAQTRNANAYGHRNAGRSSSKVAIKTVTSKRQLKRLYNIWYQIS